MGIVIEFTEDRVRDGRDERVLNSGKQSEFLVTEASFRDDELDLGGNLQPALPLHSRIKGRKQ